MAVQSLYRRYRPRRFSELRGQDHVVRALKSSVINHREGHGYLFSGPRGTGKTSTARILAKVLNCEAPVDGEPCCECPSCVAVEAGTSYDVLELDAASHNGVEEIRGLIESASLSSPGRHRVFILDEVHMLTRGAEAALLKTLEEPPEHVVFVLATTDPQKVSETIRSRVQHLQFHLLPLDDLEEYVRHVVADAGLEVDDAAVAWALEQGAGSARDTLSALELAASGGGDVDEPAALDELLEALVARDQGRALAAVAFAARQGRDPRTFAEDTVRTLRDAFLSLMAPELVHLPDKRAAKVAAMAESLGAAAVVRSMEALGETLVEMRHAADPRLLLDIAVVKLSSPAAADGAEALAERITLLEQTVREMRERFASGAPLPPAPRDPTTGRARPGSRAGTAPGPAPARVIPPDRATDTAPDPTPASAPTPDAAPSSVASAAPESVGRDGNGGDPAALWPRVLEALKPLPRAIFKPGAVTAVDDGSVTVTLGNAESVKGASRYVDALEAAITSVCGGARTVVLAARERSDDTASGGIARTGIVAEVAVDPTAPIDPNDITDEAPAVDPSIERLKTAFPGARVVVEGQE